MVHVVNDDQLTAVTPAEAPGPVVVSLTSQFGTASAAYSFLLTPTMSVTASSAAVVYGHEQSAKVSVKLTGAHSLVPSGTVTLTYGTKMFTSILLVNGAGSWVPSSVALPAGKDAIVATYAGNKYFASVSDGTSPVHLSITKATTSAALSLSSTTVKSGSEKSLVFTVKVKPQYAGAVTGTASVQAGSTLLCKVQLKNGVGHCSPSSATALGAGAHSLKAHYGGSLNFNTSTSRAVSLTVT